MPPPGRLGRPEPYSPTERNNLNKVSKRQAHTLPSAHRTSGGSAGFHGDPSWAREHVSGRGRAPEARTGDRGRVLANQFGDAPPEPVHGPSPRSAATLPNGLKPKGRGGASRKAEKYEMHSESNIPVRRDSDEDEDDWC